MASVSRSGADFFIQTPEPPAISFSFSIPVNFPQLAFASLVMQAVKQNFKFTPLPKIKIPKMPKMPKMPSVGIGGTKG
jgi:hypothetical protein